MWSAHNTAAAAGGTTVDAEYLEVVATRAERTAGHESRDQRHRRGGTDAGLLAARGRARAVLFEKAPAPRAGGYLIDFWGLGYEIAERMGICRRCASAATRCASCGWSIATGARTRTRPEADVRGARGRFISLARADLAAALAGACGHPGPFRRVGRGDRQDDGGAVVTLSDGRTERFDLVVGADGLHSQVRTLTFGAEAQFERLLGCHVAAFRISGYPRRDELTYVSHTVPRRQVARVALRNDETLVLLVCRAELVGAEWPPPGEPRAALRRAFGGMGWETPELLDAMDAADDVYFDRVSQIHLPHWSAVAWRSSATRRHALRCSPAKAPAWASRGVRPRRRTASSRRRLCARTRGVQHRL